MDDIYRRLPKIELHAHLTGSIRVQTLHEIWKRKRDEDDQLIIEDPLMAMPVDKVDYDLKTFFPLFSSYIYKLVQTQRDVIETTRAVLEDFEDDGVVYLELRTTPRGTSASDGKSMTKAIYIETILDTIRKYEGESDARRMKTKLILSIDRRMTLEQAQEVIDLALANRDRGVVGIDLCGDPSKGPISHLAPAFRRAKEEELKLTLHFAEAPQSSSGEELETLLSWQPDRIGHVIHVKDEYKKAIIAANIGVELCISCNVNAKMLTGGGGFADHHFGWWRQNHLGVALCTDDVGVFGSPLSNEYRLAAQHFNLDRKAMIKLCRGVVGITFADEDTKSSLLELYTDSDR